MQEVESYIVEQIIKCSEGRDSNITYLTDVPREYRIPPYIYKVCSDLNISLNKTTNSMFTNKGACYLYVHKLK